MATNVDSMVRLRAIISATTVSKGAQSQSIVEHRPSTQIDPTSALLPLKSQTGKQLPSASANSNPSVLTCKRDDGKGAQRIMFSCLDEVFKKKTVRVMKRTIPIRDAKIINNASNMIEKFEHPHMERIPLKSSYIEPRFHTTDRRKLIINLCDRMKISDPKLVRICLGCEEIDDDLLKQISLALKASVYTKEIFLTKNTITDEGIGYLVESLKNHNSIKLLSLGGNLITDIGAKLLSNLCSQNPNIQQLNLSNKWPAQFVLKIGIGDIFHPFISSIGANYFAEKMTEKTFSLTSLSLCDQRIGNSSFIFGITRTQLVVILVLLKVKFCDQYVSRIFDLKFSLF